MAHTVHALRRGAEFQNGCEEVRFGEIVRDPATEVRNDRREVCLVVWEIGRKSANRVLNRVDVATSLRVKSLIGNRPVFHLKCLEGGGGRLEGQPRNIGHNFGARQLGRHEKTIGATIRHRNAK